MAAKLISPQRVVRFECYCMIGLGASAGGEAGRGSAAARLTKISGAGIDELRDMLKDARRSEDVWNNFLEDFVEDPDVIARVKYRDPR